MDLSKLSDSDLAALQRKDYSKLSDEGLTYLQAQNKPNAPSAIASSDNGHTQGESGFTKFAKNVASAAYDNLPAEGAMVGGLLGNVPGAALGAAAGGGLKRLIGGFQSQGKDFATSTPTASGIAQSFADTAGDAMGGAIQEVGGKLIGAGINKVGGALGAGSDYLAQKSFGMKKVIPGVGNTALDEGVWGTQSRMRNQMSKGLDKYENQLQGAVGKISQPIDSGPVANKVLGAADGYQTPMGRTTTSSAPYVNQAVDQAADVEARGSVPANEALSLKRINQRIGFRRGEPLESFKGKLAQTEARGYGSALSDAAANESNPGVIPEANSKLSDLLKANKSLNAPDKIKSALGISDIAADVIGGAPAVVAKKILGTAPVQSTAAKGLKIGSDVMSSDNATPLARLLMGLKNSDSGN